MSAPATHGVERLAPQPVAADAGSLLSLLERFAAQVNEHPNLRGVLAGWAPDFHIQALDSGDTFQVCFAGGQLSCVLPTDAEPGDDALLLRGDTRVLRQVFSGALSPLGAYTDGQLEVYGPTKDQIKLDVIALVLWKA